MVFFSLRANTVAIFIAEKVLPSPLIDEVTISVFVPDCCFLYKNCKEDLMALKLSDSDDLGFSKTAKLLLELFLPITPKIGILVILDISSVFLIEVSKRVIPKTSNKGSNKLINSAKI